MKKQDLYIGAVVYHSTFTHLGKGKVLGKGTRVHWTSKGYTDQSAYKIEWEHIFGNGENYCYCQPSELRKTFNQRKADLIETIKSLRK